jgi:D-alanyl-D-alanine carboxypeptidase/D-alanyl-D-alanine-endopeptidase (penicillin-binding protein 4)
VGFGRRIGDSLRLPGGGRRRGLTVLVVLAVAGASGGAVALTGPTLVQQLGLGRADAAEVIPPIPRAVLGPLPVDAPLPTATGLSDTLDEAALAMPGRFAGVVVDPATGKELWSHTPERALTPASTGKLLTASAALLTFNPTDTFVTRVVAGPEPGTVVLVGGGDPTLTALPDGEEGVYPDPARISDLAGEVRKAVQEPVRRVLVDTSRYKGPSFADTWNRLDIAAGFIAPIEPLMLDGGRIDPSLQDGPRIEDPALAAGRALARALNADPGLVAEGTAAAGAKNLGVVGSAPVAELVEHVMRTSDNVLAETLAREVALARKGEPSFAGAAQETTAALAQAGFDPTGAVMVDGSGLSTEDKVPVRLLGSLLAAIAAPAQGPLDKQFLRPILTGVPVAGGDGTLDERFARDGDAAAGRGVARAKTGTLTSVSSLAGVVTDADGRLLAFALMSNGAPAASVRPRQDAIVALLSRCGCR